jgi:hypothetical protein
MKIDKKQKIFLAVLGLLLGSSLTLAAFTEPTVSPANFNGGAPINVSNTEQIRTGKLAIGDGTIEPSDGLISNSNFYVGTVLGADTIFAKNNANFLGNVVVKGNFVVSGLIRAGQIVTKNDTNLVDTTEMIFPLHMPSGATTNLNSTDAAYCTSSSYCPPGTTMQKFNYNGGSPSFTCRYLTPTAKTRNLVSCLTSSDVAKTYLKYNINPFNVKTCDVYTGNNPPSGKFYQVSNSGGSRWTGSGNVTYTLKSPESGILDTASWYKWDNGAWTYIGSGNSQTVTSTAVSPTIDGNLSNTYEPAIKVEAYGKNGVMTLLSNYRTSVTGSNDSGCSQQSGSTGGSTGQ